MNIKFRTNATGIWQDIGVNNSQPNGTYTQTYTFLDPTHKYYWSVNCSDGKDWTNETFVFTTGLPPTVHLFTINHTAHMDYGCTYPVTYVFNLSTYSTNLKAYKYDGCNWTLIPTKNQSEIQNGIEAARFDYIFDKAYISASFPAESDNIILKITDESDNKSISTSIIP